MDGIFKYKSITKADWIDSSISQEKKDLMIDYIRYADHNNIELTMDQIDFKFTLLSPEAVDEMSKNYGYPIEKQKWIITVAVSGDKGYDIFSAANELNEIWWVRSAASKNIKIGDIVYLYVGKPFSKIMYAFICVDENDDLSSKEYDKDKKFWNNPEFHNNDRKRYFKIKKLKYVNDDNLGLKKLNELGLVKGRIQGSFKSDNNPQLFEYIENQFSKARKNIFYFENDTEYDVDVNNDGEIFAVTDEPQDKLTAEFVNGIYKYKRDSRIGRYAVECAGYKCEIDGTHRTFISRDSDKPYLESHHLVPISAQDNFNYSLDVPANIVALCSTCHNEIHYGKSAKKLICKLYKNRKERLEKAGIKISIDELLRLYSL